MSSASKRDPLLDRFDESTVAVESEPDVYFESPRPFVDPGLYLARYLSHKIRTMWGTPRLIVNFVIVEGDYGGFELSLFYTLSEIRDGKPIATYQCKLREDMKRLFNADRLDRFSFKKSFEGKVCTVKVVTVERNFQGNQLDVPYSKISEIKEIKAAKNVFPLNH